jgi:CBS domain-containing protein
MQVSEIMSSPAVTVDPTVTVHDAIGGMLNRRIGSVVVTETGVVGILTRSDALRAAYHAGASLDEIPVSKAMSENVVTTGPDSSIQSVLRTMETHQIKKLPVVEEFDLVGIVTISDIARHRPADVQEIRGEIDRQDEWTD